jgi:hypothetical protein
LSVETTWLIASDGLLLLKEIFTLLASIQILVRLIVLKLILLTGIQLAV